MPLGFRRRKSDVPPAPKPAPAAPKEPMPTPIASHFGVASSAPPPSAPVTAPAPSPTTHTPSPLQHSATAPSSAAASPTKSRKLFASLRSKSYDKATSSIRTLGRRASNEAAPPPVPGLPASLSVPPPATADPPRRRSGDAGRPSLHLDTAIGVATSSTPMGSASSSFNLRSFRQVSGVRMEPVRSHTPSSSSPPSCTPQYYCQAARLTPPEIPPAPPTEGPNSELGLSAAHCDECGPKSVPL